MPLPINPSGFGSRGADEMRHAPLGINFDALERAMLRVTKTAPKMQVMASDDDADILFRLWNESTENGDGYTPPQGFSNDDLMRLKASNLICGDDRAIRFTQKGSTVIQTMVLGEENSYAKTAVKKPYSVILADIRSPKRASNLALASAGLPDVLAQRTPPNISIDPSRRPTAQTPYVSSTRLHYTGGSSNKEYTVRVYRGSDGRYLVMCFNGRYGQTQTMQPKGDCATLSEARAIAAACVDSKRGEGYSTAGGENSTIPGVPDSGPARPAAATPRAEPQRAARPVPRAEPPPRPAPAAPRRTPAAQPSPQGDDDSVPSSSDILKDFVSDEDLTFNPNDL